MRVADYIMERLYETGIRHIFMVTGRGILYLTDAAARRRGLHTVCMHHEQSASFAAFAYAAYNQTAGACLVSSGCASTNAMTGLLCAWQDGVPCIFVSGQNKLHETVRYTKKPIRTYGQQETDIVELVKPVTKYAVMITKAQDIAYEMDRAFAMAHAGRKGPVWVDVPLDIQNMHVEPEKLRRYIPESQNGSVLLKEDAAFVAAALHTARRPVLLIGSGIRSSGAVETLYEFLDRYPMPVVFDSAAADIYGLDNRTSIGAVGSPGGTRAGNFTVQNADLVLAVGCRLSPMTTGPQYNKFARKAQLFVVDIDQAEHEKNTVRIDRLVIADAQQFFTALEQELSAFPGMDISRWIDRCLHWKMIFPKCEEKYRHSGMADLYALADCLSGLLADDAVFLCDAGIEELICPSVISFQKNRRCIHPVSQGAMGFALPAAIGAYYAGGCQTAAVIGDGSVMMNLQELQTIFQNQVPVKIIITNNNGYAVIRQRQQELFRGRIIGTDPAHGLSCPDFEAVAHAFGIPYRKITDAVHMEERLRQFLLMDGPAICEVLCVEEQEYIRNGYARTADKKFVQRPLEDQAPFMERELFLAEMVIEPIDL